MSKPTKETVYHPVKPRKTLNASTFAFVEGVRHLLKIMEDNRFNNVQGYLIAEGLRERLDSLIK